MKKIPNMLSVYRLASLPVLLYLIYVGNQHLFAILFCVNLITDILDGFIARKFNAATPIGARLDSLADLGSYIAALYAISKFYWGDIAPYKIWFFAFVITFIVSQLLSFVKFKTFPSLHLYSFKTSGYAQGIFLFALFIDQFIPWLFIVAMSMGTIACLEETIVILYLKELKSDVKSILYVIRE
jgi:cardiolipin synthase